MRRKIVIFLGLAGVLVVVLMLSGKLSLPRREFPDAPLDDVGLVEYLPRQPFTPSPGHPMSQMQDMVDQVSVEAEQGKWQAAADSVERLQETWERGTFKQEQKLQIEREITETILSLRHHVWAQNRKETLQAAEKISTLIKRLASD